MDPSKKETHQQSLDFESAYARIEAILEELNSGQVSLDRSLSLYEEADTLISQCAQRLDQAERRVAILMKKRDGTLQTDAQGTPRAEEWHPSPSSHSPDSHPFKG